MNPHPTHRKRSGWRAQGNLFPGISFFALLAAGLWLMWTGCSPKDVSCTQSSDCPGQQQCVSSLCTPHADGGKETSSEGVQDTITEPPVDAGQETGSEPRSPDTASEPRPEPGAPDESQVRDEPVIEQPSQELVQETPAGPKIKIFIAGDTKPVTFNDGLAGQTPKNFFMGFQKFEILTSRNDANPALVFDYRDGYKKAPMVGRNLVGEGTLATISDGTYTYGRTTVVFMTFDVSATAHLNNFALPGNLNIYYALGNHKDEQNASLQIGDVKGTFTAAGQTVPYQTNVPVNFTLSDPETWVDTSTGKTQFYFKIGKDIVKDAATGDIEVTLHFNIYQAYRWRDLQQGKFQKDVYDITTNPAQSEPVLRYGANSYHITQP